MEVEALILSAARDCFKLEYDLHDEKPLIEIERVTYSKVLIRMCKYMLPARMSVFSLMGESGSIYT